MLREWTFFFQDMIEFCEKILTYTNGLSRQQFETSGQAYDATVWNVSLFGEAAKNIPEDIRNQLPEIPWRELIGIRNKLSHGYFGIDNNILWDVIQHEVPKLYRELQRIRVERPELFGGKSTA
jgi:uncharacterized protein with HEPN domain